MPIDTFDTPLSNIIKFQALINHDTFQVGDIEAKRISDVKDIVMIGSLKGGQRK